MTAFCLVGLRAVLASLCLFAFALFASANDAIVSSYNPGIDCKITSETDTLIDFRCPGVFGVDVWFLIGAARWFVAFHESEPAGLVLKQGFNRAHHPDLQIEWRFDGNRPMAAIQIWRFYDGDELDEGAYVITKIDGDSVCHMGLIDIAENPDALALARKLADSSAVAFSCENDPLWVGNPPSTKGHTHYTHR